MICSMGVSVILGRIMGLVGNLRAIMRYICFVHVCILQWVINLVRKGIELMWMPSHTVTMILVN